RNLPQNATINLPLLIRPGFPIKVDWETELAHPLFASVAGCSHRYRIIAIAKPCFNAICYHLLNDGPARLAYRVFANDLFRHLLVKQCHIEFSLFTEGISNLLNPIRSSLYGFGSLKLIADRDYSPVAG